MSKSYKVFLPRKDGSLDLIDTVFFTGYTVEEVRRNLINHDGLDYHIVVKDSAGNTTSY